VAIYFDEPFDNPVAYPGSPADFWDWNGGVETNANYPKLAIIGNCEVVAGALTVGSHGEDPYTAGDAGAYFGVMPDCRNDEYTPNAPRDVMYLEADILFRAIDIDDLYDSTSNAPLLAVYQGFSGWGVMGAQISLDDPDVGQHTLGMWMHVNNGETDWYEVNFTNAEMEALLITGTPIKVRLEWQCATYSYAPWTVAQDGYCKLLFNGVEMLAASNVSLTANYIVDGSWPPQAVYGISIGLWGFAGTYDNLRVGSGLAETWIDIADFVEQELSDSLFPGGAARVVCEAWSSE